MSKNPFEKNITDEKPEEDDDEEDISQNKHDWDVYQDKLQAEKLEKPKEYIVVDAYKNNSFVWKGDNLAVMPEGLYRDVDGDFDDDEEAEKYLKDRYLIKKYNPETGKYEFLKKKEDGSKQKAKQTETEKLEHEDKKPKYKLVKHVYMYGRGDLEPQIIWEGDNKNDAPKGKSYQNYVGSDMEVKFVLEEEKPED